MGVFVNLTKRDKPKALLAPSNPSAVLAMADRGKVGKSSAGMYRNWSEHSEWVRAAINLRKAQVSSADWGIVPFLADEPNVNLTMQMRLREMFDRPNAKWDSFRGFIEPIVEDILVLDAGCLHSNELVLLADGTKRRIGDIVNQKQGVEVMAFDEATGALVPRRVIGWHRNPLNGRTWVKASLRHARNMGKHGRRATWFTHDHQVLTEKGWMEVASVGSTLVITGETRPNARSREVFDGTMLGDACLEGRGVRRGLTFSQKDHGWADRKAEALLSLGMVSSLFRGLKRHRSGYGGWLEEQSERWYVGRRKVVPVDLVLTDLVLATWFMDDGHRHVTQDSRGNECEIAYFNTHGFSVDDQKRLVGLLEGVGIESNLQASGKYWRIYLTADGTRQLMVRIASLVPVDMARKTGGRESQADALWVGFGSEPFLDHLDVVPGNPSGGSNPEPTWAYCIDVEEHHDFITSGLVAHNCIEKVRSIRNEVVELWGVDGATIKVNAFWDGDDDEPRYFWYPDYQERAKFKNDELVYIMANPSTYRVIGLSPLETLKMTVDAELSSSDYNRRQVTEAAPDGILNIGEGARPEDVDRFKSYWSAEVAGKGAMAIIGGTKAPSFIGFRPNNRDMQFNEWQIYLVRKICAVFGISPQDIGITYDINRATSEVLNQQTEDRGLRPLMSLIQDFLTREIVWDPAFGGKENGLAFRFTALNLKESRAKADINKIALSGTPWKTPNEARIDDGREPFGPEYDDLFMVTPTGAVRLADVPTAREVFEAQNAPKPASEAKPAVPGSKPAKAATV